MSRPANTEPIVFAILDGWGNRAEAAANTIANAKTPIFDRLAARGIRTMVAAGGDAVGLPADHPGNAEAGHRTLGSGRTQPQFANRVTSAIAGEGNETFADNPLLQGLIQKARSVGGAVHLIGLISPAGVQGHQYHLAVLAALLSHEGIQVWIHAILDGEDTGTQEGADFLGEFLRDIEGAENAHLATLMGRRYALDRLHRPAQLSAALKTIAEADAPVAEYAVPYIAGCYDNGLTDAEVPPVIMPGYGGLRQDDVPLLALLRAESASPLIAGLIGHESAPQSLPNPIDLSAAYSLTPLAPPLGSSVKTLFEEHLLTGTLSDALANAGKRQLYLSDAAFTAGLSWYQLGGRTEQHEGETHLTLHGHKRQQFEKKPELAALDIADEAVKQIKAGAADVVIIHFPNVALAAHSANAVLARKAAEIVDKALGKITAILEKRGGTLVITGSHGNAEDMRRDETGTANSRNTRAAVPFVIDGPRDLNNAFALKPGHLADVAPTLLSLMGLDTPKEMTGHSLLVSDEAGANEAV
jgi:2,3-bisphosphoglycerate-independent phosphoglycerate mutase